MATFYDLAYTLGLAASSPVWLSRGSARGKVLSALRQRMGDVPRRDGDGPCVMIHAVSLGEINATRTLVDELRARRAGLHVVVSTTTDTGFARGQELYGRANDVTLIRYPLDFSQAVVRVLDRLRPDVVVLMELEIWPNFLIHCRRRGVPVMLINGRLSDYSYQRYRMPVLRGLARSMLGRLSDVAVQDEAYRGRFIELGAPPERTSVTGTMKFDTAASALSSPGAASATAPGPDLGVECGLAGGPVWVAGSTGPGEEAVVLAVYRRLLTSHQTLRLVIVPRHPQRFDEVASLIEASGLSVSRRSRREPWRAGGVLLGDTMGELRRFYAAADVVFVGRSLVDLGHRQHGSDMIEPAALGKPTAVGPFTANFADVMRRFREASAVVEVADADALHAQTSRLLTDPDAARALGMRARDVVTASIGATRRHADLILARLERPATLTR